MKTHMTHSLKLCLCSFIITAIAGCKSAPKPRTLYVPLPEPNLPASANGSVWVPDQFAAYSVGRYVDPHDPGVLHDAHTLYRREITGRWNLAPAYPLPPVSAEMKHDTVMLRDALTAELNRQRATSEALIGQARILDQHLRELNAQSLEFHNVLQQSYQLRDQLMLVSNRLESIEGQLRNQQHSSEQPASRP